MGRVKIGIVGCGAISGAYLGHNAVPKDWRKRIENRQLLIDLSKQLCQKHAL